MKTDHLDPRRAEEDLKLKVLQAISAALKDGQRYLAVDLQTGEIDDPASGGIAEPPLHFVGERPL